MTATRLTSIDVAQPAGIAEELMRLNHRLAKSATIARDIRAAVLALVEAIERTDLSRWDEVDSRHALLVYRTAISAQLAVEEGSRDRLRIALDGLGQALTAIAEQETVSDEKSGKELVQLLAERTEVPQARLASLLGVSARQFQRWLSSNEAAQPEGDDLRKVRAVSRIVNQLRFALTPAGVVDWFGWKLPELGGKTPQQLLDDPRKLPELIVAAAAMRGTLAT